MRSRRRPFPEGANQDSPNLQQLIKLCSRMPRHPPHCPSSSFSTWRIALPSCASLFHLSDRLFVLRNTDMQEKAKARLRELAPRGQKEPGGRINTTQPSPFLACLYMFFSFGASIYNVRNFFLFYDPLHQVPYVIVTNQLIVFFSSAFRHPLPHPLQTQTSCMEAPFPI